MLKYSEIKQQVLNKLSSLLPTVKVRKVEVQVVQTKS